MNTAKLLVPIRKNGKWGFMNQSGRIAVEPRFDSTTGGNEGIYSFRLNGKYGFLASDGKIRCEPVFDAVDSFNEGLCGAVRGNQKGFLDRTFKFSFLHSYKKCFEFHEGLVIGYNELLDYDYLDKAGRVVLRGNISLSDSSEGLICFKEKIDSGYGFRNRNGEWVIAPKFELAKDFSEGLAGAVIKQGRKLLMGFIDKTGEFVIPPRYPPEMCRFREGCAVVWKVTKGRAKAGFIDRKGKQVIPYIYDLAEDFSEGLAHIIIKEKSGFINLQGDMVIKPSFDSASQFKNGLAWVQVGKQCGYIDREGELLHLG